MTTTTKFANSAAPGPLASGWEIRMTSTRRIYSVDHSTRTTTWGDPQLPSYLRIGNERFVGIQLAGQAPWLSRVSIPVSRDNLPRKVSSGAPAQPVFSRRLSTRWCAR